MPAPAIAPRVGEQRDSTDGDEHAPVEADAGQQREQRPAAQTIASAPSSATFAQNSVFAGAISSAASRPTTTA